MDFSQNHAPTPPGRSVGAPGNVQARGLNPAQSSDQKYAAGSLKVPYCMWLVRHSAAGKVSCERDADPIDYKS